MEGLIFGILRYKPQGLFSEFYGIFQEASPEVGDVIQCYCQKKKIDR